MIRVVLLAASAAIVRTLRRSVTTLPGFVALEQDELIKVQQAALLAYELETDCAVQRAEIAGHRRTARARELVVSQCAAAGLELEPVEVDELLDVLPARPAGELHEPAFLALLGQVLLARRMTLIHDRNGDSR